MAVVGRFTTIWTLILAALALSLSAPASAQNSTGEYRGALDALNLEMRAMWGELDRFKVEPRYCRPPPPSKAEAQAELAALEKRVTELNGRYQAMRQSLLSFLDNNHRLYSELMVNNVDPRDRRWWTHYEASRKKMFDELAAKRAALAAAPEVNCGPQPKQTPSVTAPPQPPSQPTQSSLPQRPSYDPLNWPPFPPHFCSWDEYWKFIIERINPLYEKAAENAELAAKFRTSVEVAVNNHVQAGRPVPPALQALRRQAIADVAQQDRLSRESEDIRRRAKAIPVIDCRQPQTEPPQQDLRTGQAPAKEMPQWAQGLDVVDTFKVGMQQRIIDEVEDDLKALDEMARRRGYCGALYDEADDIDFGFDELEDGGAFPPEMIRQWRTRLDEIMDDCPAPRFGFPSQIRLVIPSDPRMRIILEGHNKARADVGSPPLTWDPDLAAGAETYARQLTTLGRVHAPREGRKDIRENLLQSLRGGRSPQAMVDVWIDEKRYFKPGIFPDVSITGEWAKVGHYTQMIWPTTTKLGCAIHSDLKYDWTVCRYSPPGNRDGSPVLMGSGQPVIAQDIAPPNSSTPTIPPVRFKLPMGGGMTQIDPPPPPPPTARDDAPEGDEARHPLVVYGAEADANHARETDRGNTAMARLELEKMRYALDELKKRLKAAKKAKRFSTVKPEDVQRQIDEMERRIREAELRGPRPPGGPQPLPPSPPSPTERG